MGGIALLDEKKHRNTALPYPLLLLAQRSRVERSMLRLATIKDINI